MNQGIFSGVAAMDSAERRLELISSNLANVATHGYKRHTAFTRALESADGKSRSIATGSRVDFSQGEIQRTGNTFDLALDGEGFFAVESRDGEVYTRSGRFRLDSQGVLVNQSGFPVAWEGPAGIIDPSGEEVTIDGEGAVRQGGRQIGKLRIVNFDARDQLSQDGEGNFVAHRGMREVAHTATVHQAALEGANVSPIEELVSMITVQRSFESASRVVSTITDTYRRLAQRA